MELPPQDRKKLARVTAKTCQMSLFQNPVGANLRFDETSSGKRLFQNLTFWNSLKWQKNR
jgi:hypothetical protein